MTRVRHASPIKVHGLQQYFLSTHCSLIILYYVLFVEFVHKIVRKENDLQYFQSYIGKLLTLFHITKIFNPNLYLIQNLRPTFMSLCHRLFDKNDAKPFLAYLTV